MRRSAPRGIVALIIVALALSVAAGPIAARPAESPPMPEPAVTVTSASDAGMAIVHPALRAWAATAAADDEVHIALRVKNGVDITPYLRVPLIRPFSDDGLTTVYGLVRIAGLPKLANLSGVDVILPIRGTHEPPRYRDPDAPGRPATQAARTEEVGVAAWHDVLDTHKSKAAWDKGFTGEGVRVAVLDSGVDFGHPDLQGTQAVQPFGDYAGWPIAIDGWSLFLKAYDFYLGYSNVADGLSWYADTSTTVRTGASSYQPLFAAEPHTYILPGTSISGEYHIGSHPDDSLNLYWYGERVAVLVVDEHVAGVYDTVYVDLDNDYDFTDERACTKDDPISTHDLNGDGFADLSGGMVYWISDGRLSVPFGWLWGFPPDPAGDLVAFFINDETEPGGDHGTLCASAVVGQGVIDGNAPAYKPAGDGTPGTGLVVGGGRDVELVGVGNHYIYGDSDYDHYLLMVYGLDGETGTGDEIQIASNSWGFSQVHNDGWTYVGRMISSRQRHYNPEMSVLFSTGNGGPGFGTLTPPEDTSFIGVAASTQMGSTGWDSATTMDQITYGDIAAWSNRGPTAQGNVGVQIAADGAYASGDLPLNIVGDGWYAWDTWGGTSRSAPTTAGNLALIYDAFKQATGRWPTYQEAKEILMSGATSAHHNVTLQGAGLVNADRATDIAAGLAGIQVSPEEWTAGDYRGHRWPGFTKLAYPGKSYSNVFTVGNAGFRDSEVTITTDALIRTGKMSFEWDSSHISLENGYRFDYPNYLKDLTADIPPNTDLMIIRMAMPYDSFDPTGGYDWMQDNLWRLVIYDWTDVNMDGILVEDLNGNGTVNCPDGWGTAGCEIQGGEYVRFAYLHSASPTEMVTIQQPLERMHDGIWLGLQHNMAQATVPVTHLKFRIEFYQHMPWDVLSIGAGPLSPAGVAADEMTLTVPGGGSAEFTAFIDLPADMAVGFYEGAILLTDPAYGTQVAHTTTIPVAFNVASPSPNFVFGGPPASPYPYDNGRIFGSMDLRWREETGDWRIFFFDVPDDAPQGTSFLIDTRWDNKPTDVDTLLLGPAEDEFTGDPEARFYDPDYYGPYTLEVTGQSNNVQIGRSVWLFNTATGGTHEIVAGEGRPGLNAVLLHNVIFAGEEIDEVVTGQVGTIRANPAPVEIVTVDPTGSTPVSVSSSLNLSDLAVDGFGFSESVDLLARPIQQDDPGDPCSASFTYDLSLAHAASLDLWTGNSGNASDVDLFLYYDANDDGVFACPGEQIASSGNPDDAERIFVSFPNDGNYRVGVLGWSVSAGGDVFDLHINAVQGTNLSVSDILEGPFPAGAPITFGLAWNVPDLAPGFQAEGVMLLGPSVAPGAVSVPVIFSSPETQMAITPGAADLRVAETQVVDLQVTAAEDLYAVEARLTYDPRVVHVRSITQGSLLPAGSSSAIIDWDDSLGTIDIAITLLQPAAAISGDGILASIEFEGVGIGTTEITCGNVTFLDTDGGRLPLWLYDSALNVQTNLGAVSGRITLQGRTDATGVTLRVAGMDFRVADPTGVFLIADVPMGMQTLIASFTGYLDAAVDVTVAPEASADAGAGILRGGDANNDGVINAQDLAIISSTLGTSPPIDPRADVNADGIVNILDLVMAGMNFGSTSPTAWQQRAAWAGL